MINKYEKLLLNIESNESKITSFTSFGNFDPSYLWTNEDMKLYPKENLKGKNILTITSSGDHALNAILNGGSMIDSFDVNIFSKYVSALKIAMIKKYGYYDFFKRMDWIENMESLNFNSKENIIDSIREYLSYDEYLFWSTFEYLRINNKVNFNDVINVYGSLKKNAYTDAFSYNKLKRNLKKAKITYYDSDIMDIEKSVNKKYDRVFLSNVLEYVLASNGPRFVNNYNDAMIKLDKILLPSSIIYGYDFNDISRYLDNMPVSLSYTYKEVLGTRKGVREKAFSLSKV